MPPTPPSTASQSTPKPRRRRGGAPKRRQVPYPTKKKDTPSIPPPPETIEDEEEEDVEEEGKQEEGNKEDEDKAEDGPPTPRYIGTPEAAGVLVGMTVLEQDKLVTISPEEQREQQRRVKERQSQLHQERITREEFARLIYAVEWLVRHEDAIIYRDTAHYSISGEDMIDFAKEYESMLVKGRQYGIQEGKHAYIVQVNAYLVNHGKDKEFFRLDQAEITIVWKKIEKAMKLKHSTRPKRGTVAFKVFVEFWHARTPSGHIPEHMKPAVPMTQSQLKAQQTQSKLEQAARLESKQDDVLEQQMLQIIQNQKCNWKSCPNHAGGQCLELNGHHYELLPTHVRFWAQSIASTTATPSQPPPNFHSKAFLKRLEQNGHKSKDKQKAESPVQQLPVFTPISTPTPPDVVSENLKNLMNLQMMKLLGQMSDSSVPPSPVIPIPSLPPPQLPPMPPRSRGYSQLPDAPARASSPVSTSNWEGYIYWICNIQGQPNRRRKEAFVRAGRILDDAFLTIAQIQRQKNPSTDSKRWPDTWNIPSGIGLHLAQSASAFQRWDASSELRTKGLLSRFLQSLAI